MLSTIEIKRNSQFINSLIELYTNKICIANFNFDPSKCNGVEENKQEYFCKKLTKTLTLLGRRMGHEAIKETKKWQETVSTRNKQH